MNRWKKWNIKIKIYISQNIFVSFYKFYFNNSNSLEVISLSLLIEIWWNIAINDPWAIVIFSYCYTHMQGLSKPVRYWLTKYMYYLLGQKTCHYRSSVERNFRLYLLFHRRTERKFNFRARKRLIKFIHRYLNIFLDTMLSIFELFDDLLNTRPLYED